MSIVLSIVLTLKKATMFGKRYYNSINEPFSIAIENGSSIELKYLFICYYTSSSSRPHTHFFGSSHL